MMHCYLALLTDDALLLGTAHAHMKVWYSKLSLSPMLQRHSGVLPHWQCTTPQCHRRRWQQSLSSSAGWCSPMSGRETRPSSLWSWCSSGMTVRGVVVYVASCDWMLCTWCKSLHGVLRPLMNLKAPIKYISSWGQVKYSISSHPCAYALQQVYAKFHLKLHVYEQMHNAVNSPAILLQV